MHINSYLNIVFVNKRLDRVSFSRLHIDPILEFNTLYPAFYIQLGCRSTIYYTSIWLRRFDLSGVHSVQALINADIVKKL